LETETTKYADILLPAALWTESEGVMINSQRDLTLFQRAIKAPGQAMADWQIIARIACEMGFSGSFSYASAEDVFEEIKRFWNPKTGYDLRGASYDRLRQTPLQWPCPPSATNDRNPIRYLNDGVSQIQYVRGDGSVPRLAFATPNGRAVFFARPHLLPEEMPDDAYPFLLNTGRLPHHWHTMTKTGKVAQLNRLNPTPFVEIHPDDAARLQISDKDPVEVASRRGLAVLPAVVSDRVRPGNCFAPFHWNDIFGPYLSINAVTNDAVDPISRQPEFKACAVTLTKVAATSNR
jgi:sulfite reductase (NADPH) flavoprotein alpha-component